ncbi:hypothetical protein ABZT06_16940 [Streptomyces sp. NPDC005483]
MEFGAKYGSIRTVALRVSEPNSSVSYGQTSYTLVALPTTG